MADVERPALRIGNAERQKAADDLGEHFSAGRLDATEFDERVQRAYQAKTVADLEPLFVDLPQVSPDPPVSGRQHRNSDDDDRARHSRRGVPLLPIMLLIILVATSVSWAAHTRVPPFFIFPMIWLFWSVRGMRSMRR